MLFLYCILLIYFAMRLVKSSTVIKTSADFLKILRKKLEMKISFANYRSLAVVTKLYVFLNDVW